MNNQMPKNPDMEPKRCPMLGGEECFKDQCMLWHKWNGCAIAQLSQAVCGIRNRLVTGAMMKERS